MRLDPNAITVLPRQRTTLGNVEAMMDSLSVVGQIQPIIIRHPNAAAERDAPILVAGQTRLEACKRLGVEVWAEFIEDLDAEAAEEIELEENVKRTDLPWRDHVTAIAKIHQRRCAADPAWTVTQTAERLSLTQPHVSELLLVYRNLDSPALKDATSARAALGILRILADRRAASLIGDMAKASAGVLESPPPINVKLQVDAVREEAKDWPEWRKKEIETEVAKTPDKHSIPATPAPTILCADFLQWASGYEGSKFNFIHCDFPYGVKFSDFHGSKIRESAGETYEQDPKIYWKLLDSFTENLDRFCSYQAHVMFWFSMKFYHETKNKLEAAGLTVNYSPLIWHKTDGLVVTPGAQTRLYPKNSYETAFVCTRGARPLVRVMSNVYGAPHATNPIHPSQKPEPVLNHFFGMFIDEHTDILDPTCGSGTSIRSAEGLKARSALGLELDPKYAELAERETARVRMMRSL